jgi:predicted ATPase
MATIFRGWGLVRQGQCADAIAELQQGLADSRAMGAEANMAHFLAFLAEGYSKAGRREEALNALADALAQVDKTQNRSNEAELYRLKGELAIQTGKPGPNAEPSDVQRSRASPESEAEAEPYFRRATETARRQGAKSFELRATTSLARLRRQQGNEQEARKILSDTYGWFTEGFDTADLKDAKALLDELSV